MVEWLKKVGLVELLGLVFLVFNELIELKGGRLGQSAGVDDRVRFYFSLANWARWLARLLVVIYEAGVAFEMVTWHQPIDNYVFLFVSFGCRWSAFWFKGQIAKGWLDLLVRCYLGVLLFCRDLLLFLNFHLNFYIFTKGSCNGPVFETYNAPRLIVAELFD